MKLAARHAIHGEPVLSRDSLANPEALNCRNCKTEGPVHFPKMVSPSSYAALQAEVTYVNDRFSDRVFDPGLSK